MGKSDTVRMESYTVRKDVGKSISRMEENVSETVRKVMGESDGKFVGKYLYLLYLMYLMLYNINRK